FQEVINELQLIALNRFPPADPARNLPGMLLSHEAYEVDETLQTRDNFCPSAGTIDPGVDNLQLRNLISIVPNEILAPVRYKKYTLVGRPPAEHTVGNLFSDGTPQAEEFKQITCLNGSVFVAEVHLSYEPIIQIDF